MATVKELMDRARTRIEANREKASSHGAIYKFVLHGDVGGTFVINLADDPGVTVGDGAAQCTIKMAAPDFVDMIEGRADGRALFFRGKLKVEGDMGLALRLKKLFETIVSRA
jgi:predicted lipid carrier protein YhbT